MTQYLLSVITPTDGVMPAPDELAAIRGRLDVLHEEMRAAGAWVFGGGLHAPDTATVIRPAGSDTLLTDGPFAEGKEYLGGLSIISAPDLDAALEWGRRSARATGLAIEVRPFVEQP